MKQHPATPQSVRLVTRVRGNNPNHHLFNNNGTWWLQVTLHNGPFSERIRQSLKTRDLAEARRKRDTLFARLSARREPESHAA